MSIQDVLVWLFGGVGASAVFSYLAERWEWFQSLTVDTKKVYKTVGASVIAILAFVAYTYVPVSYWEVLSPYWQVVVGVIAVNYGVEVFHFFDKKLVK